MADKLKSVDAGKATRKPGQVNASFIDSVVDAVTGYRPGKAAKGDPSGAGGRERADSIDSQLDQMERGKKK
jgi:hypothetical protein